MRGFKIKNEYSEALGDLYEIVPKAVIAAVAVSSLTLGGDYIEEARTRFLTEWAALYTAGIVPQKPPEVK
jgi:hypothetical protein